MEPRFLRPPSNASRSGTGKSGWTSTGNTVYDNMTVGTRSRETTGPGASPSSVPAQTRPCVATPVTGTGGYSSSATNTARCFSGPSASNSGENGAFQEGNDGLLQCRLRTMAVARRGIIRAPASAIWPDGVPGTPQPQHCQPQPGLRQQRQRIFYRDLQAHARCSANVLYDNASVTGGVNEFAPANIAIDAPRELREREHLVFNNTSVGGRYGLKVVTMVATVAQSTTTSSKTKHRRRRQRAQLRRTLGGVTTRAARLRDIGRVQHFERKSTRASSDGARIDYASYDAWETAYGLPAHSIRRPKARRFVSHHSLLDVRFPVPRLGYNPGTCLRPGLSEDSCWPAPVQYDGSRPFGSAWELGAYCYSGTGPSSIFQAGFEDGSLESWSSTAP